MFNITMEVDKFGKAANVIDAVSVVVKSNVHVNELIKASNTLITGEFVLHMSRETLGKPLKFGHMYEWGMLGDPNGRLWKHELRGRGAMRQLTFTFKASQKAVPVAPALSAIGVKKNHIFHMKASVMELGLPVRISEKLAKALVFEAKEVKRGAKTSGTGYETGGIVFHRGVIEIPRAGSAEAWGSFTTEFNTWFASGLPEEIIATGLTIPAGRTIKSAVLAKLRSIGSAKVKKKTIVLEPAGIDKSFAATLEKSLQTNYIAGTATRRAITDDSV